MGEVWLVMDKTTRALYAAKILRRDLSRSKDLQRFSREIAALRDLQHDHIIKIHEVFEAGYIMEYCPDGDVATYLRNNEAADRRTIVLHLAEAVSYLHSAGLIHRDIKPHNILIAPDGMLRLSDFGLVIESKEDRLVITTSNWVSPGFAPPEQYRDMSSTTQRGDIFSIGAVYYWLLTGATIDVWSPLEPQIQRHNDFNKYIFRRTLAARPEERFERASDIIEAFKHFSDHHLSAYFELEPADRSKYLEQGYAACFDHPKWIDGRDIDALLSLKSELEGLTRYEQDESLVKLAKKLLNSVEQHLHEIAMEMEQDNPSGY